MFRLILTISFLFIINNCVCQPLLNNYFEYYNLCNEGDRYLHKKDYINAFNKYKEGIELVANPHCEYLVKAAKLSKKLKYFDLEKYYYSKAILAGEPAKSVLKNLSLKNEAFKDSVDFFSTKHLSNINSEYKYILDSLYYIDQKVIRGNSSIKGNYKIDYTKLPQIIYSLDDSILNTLINAIKKFGFPIESTVGKNTFQNIAIIYHHNFRNPRNDIHFKIIEEALNTGSCMPATYAWLFDQKQTMLGEKPYFYFGIASTKNLTSDEKRIIDLRRKEKCIKPLEAYQVKAKKNRITQVNIW